MTKITTIGIDLAKNIFQVACLNKHNKLVSNKQYSRTKLIELMANHPPCLVGLEACGSAHYWHRIFTNMGHTVKLLPPAYVKGFLYGNKNDKNDAKAIALAVAQDETPIVNAKTAEQLALQAMIRVRRRRVKQRTDCSNQIRGLLYEHGLVITKGFKALRSLEIEKVPAVIRPLILNLLDEFKAIDSAVTDINKQVQQRLLGDPMAQQLSIISGFGMMNIIAALIINPSDFRNGRHYAAYLGLVPKQVGTGGKVKLQGISKRGNRYHRQLLIHGARAFLTRNKTHNDPLWLWAQRIQAKKGHNVAVTALANKLARVSWQVLNGQTYCVNKAAAPIHNQ